MKGVGGAGSAGKICEEGVGKYFIVIMTIIMPTIEIRYSSII